MDLENLLFVVHCYWYERIEVSWSSEAEWGWLSCLHVAKCVCFWGKGEVMKGGPALILHPWYRVTLGMFSFSRRTSLAGGAFVLLLLVGKVAGCVWPRQVLQCQHHMQRGENCSRGKFMEDLKEVEWPFYCYWHYDIFLLLFACRIGILRTLRWFQRTLFPLLRWLAWLQPLWWKWTLSERTVKRGQWVFWLLWTGWLSVAQDHRS